METDKGAQMTVIEQKSAERSLPAEGRLRRFAPQDDGRAAFQRRRLLDIVFLLEFGGFQALAYFGFFAGFYFDGLGFGYQAFGFEEYGVVAGF
jgi:hypothetical protein